MPSLFAIVKEWRSLRSCLCWCSELVCFAFYQPPSHLYIRSCIPYSVSCICPVSCTEMHIHAFFKSAPKIPAKGQAMPKGPLLDISYPFLWGTSLQALGSAPDISPLHTECERWYADKSGTRNKELCNSCPPAFTVQLCTWADSNYTDTGWEVSSRWVSLVPRDDQISYHSQAVLPCEVKWKTSGLRWKADRGPRPTLRTV